MKNGKEEFIQLDIGSNGQDYQVGNFLNAVDELCCTMKNNREITDGEMADALEMYAKKLRREE